MVSSSSDRNRVSCAYSPLVVKGKSPFWSLMQKFDPSRIVIATLCVLGRPHDSRAAGLGEGLDDELVDVHVRGPGDRKEHAVGDVLGRQRFHALVDALRLLRVPAKTDERELRLDQARVDRGQ